jgi:hypothetical protein
MSNDEFTKLYKYMTERFDKIDATLEKKADADEVYHRLDDIAARLDDDGTERAALSVQVDRHEGWIHKLAETTQTDLAVEA